jgi:hypothetical protein
MIPEHMGIPLSKYPSLHLQILPDNSLFCGTLKQSVHLFYVVSHASQVEEHYEHKGLPESK